MARPTEEQFAVLTEALLRESIVRDGPPGVEKTAVLVLWPLIRDMVLEEAAKACEATALEGEELDRADAVQPDSRRGLVSHGYTNGALFAAAAIRALKDE